MKVEFYFTLSSKDFTEHEALQYEYYYLTKKPIVDSSGAGKDKETEQTFTVLTGYKMLEPKEGTGNKVRYSANFFFLNPEKFSNPNEIHKTAPLFKEVKNIFFVIDRRCLEHQEHFGIHNAATALNSLLPKLDGCTFYFVYLHGNRKKQAPGEANEPFHVFPELPLDEKEETPHAQFSQIQRTGAADSLARELSKK